MNIVHFLLNNVASVTVGPLVSSIITSHHTYKSANPKYRLRRINEWNINNPNKSIRRIGDLGNFKVYIDRNCDDITVKLNDSEESIRILIGERE